MLSDQVDAADQVKAPIRGGRGGFMSELLSREEAFVTPLRGELAFTIGELAWNGDLAALLADDRLRSGVMTASADFPDRTGRETEARMVGSDGS